MAKIVDITDKLNFDENPKLKINGKELEVNADATTVLKIMGVLGDVNEAGPKEIIKMYELIFREKERKEIDKLKLNFKDFQTLVQAAISLVVGEEEQGEQ